MTADTAKNGGTRGLLVVNTKSAHAGAFGASATDAGKGSDEHKKTRVGLLRVKLVPRGSKPETWDKSEKAVYARALRWLRLRWVQSLAEHMATGERVGKCYRVRITPNVRIHRAQEIKRAHYRGLMVCGSVWACPVCAAKISERRKKELEAAQDEKFSKFMATYTMQHSRGEKLKALKDDFLAAMREVKHSRGYHAWLEKWQIVGTVTGSEVTVSDVNGWHFHKHALSYSTLPQSVIEKNAHAIRRELSELFILQMSKRGRYVHHEIGVNVQADKDVKNAYIAKYGDVGRSGSDWSLEAELTKSIVKTGRGSEHYHPFELLDMYNAGNVYAGKLFIEYMGAMKGSRQIVFSRGLRKLLGLGVELSDEEIAEREDTSASLFAELEPRHWQIILKHEKRAQLLEVASTGNYNALVVYMRALGCDDFGV